MAGEFRRYQAITKPIVFDLARESVKEEVGIIPETFRQRPEAIRSTHICHSVTAIVRTWARWRTCSPRVVLCARLR